MKEWTLEERYRVLHNADEIKDIYQHIQTSDYRQMYHIQPVTGLSSDPNGFVLHEGKWHLFYQWCPWGAVHGLKYWYHVTSKDLISWENEGIGLKPDSFYDNKGTHSGSAISVNKELYLFYTGNHRDNNWHRTPYTCMAKLNKNGKSEKLSKPLFGPQDNYSEHQRDPKVFYNSEKGKYYIFIGAQSQNAKGCVLVYESKNLLNGWSFSGKLKVPGYEDFGGMWECPCIERISEKDVLIFSPQYIKLPGRAGNINHNIYLIGNMDYDTLTLTPESDYQHLDYGFDFYAAQLASNTGDPDKAVIIAWMRLPDNHYPTESEDWEGSMTLPRELRIHDTDYFELCLFTTKNRNGGMKFCYDAKKSRCTVDRSEMHFRFNEHLGESLDIPLEHSLNHLQIFIDRSSVELFLNHGEAVFTFHVYPTKKERYYSISSDSTLKMWELRKSVKDNFII